MVQSTVLLLALAGAALVGRWLFQWEWMGRLVPSSIHMGIVAPSVIVCGAVCILLQGGPAPRALPLALRYLARAANGVMIGFPAAMLVEHVAGVSLGVDMAHADAMATASNLFPGRMSPNACLAFLSCGLALWVLREGRSAGLVLTLSGVALFIGTAGLAGYFLHLEALYAFANFNRLLAPTALGITVLGWCTWTLQRQALRRANSALLPSESQIGARALTVVGAVAVFGGLVGFSVMRETFEASLADNMRLLTETNAAALVNSLDSSLWFPKTLATRPAVSETMAALEQAPGDEAARSFLIKVGASFFSAGFSAVSFYDSRGTLLAQVGAAANADTVYPLQAQALVAQLVWKDGYKLRTSHAVALGGGKLPGRLVTEQSLPAFDLVLTRIREGNRSADALVCGRGEGDAVCAPTRFYPKVFRIPMRDRNGRLNLPMNHALMGETGVELAKDLRGTAVIAGYAPIGTYGIGLVVKTNLETAYAPLRDRIGALLLGLLAIIATGTLAIRGQVHPLVARLAKEQRRTSVILENSSDAFIALDPQGRVTDWNSRAEAVFGWRRSEVTGRIGTDLILPPATREAQQARLQRFQQSVERIPLSRTIEVAAVAKNGREFPIELSIAGFNDGEGPVVTLLARDVTERAAATAKVLASEQRLRSITDNLPVMIFCIDRAHVVRFANETVREWLGADPKAAVGMSLLQLVGAELYQDRLPYLMRAMAGERVEFAAISTTLGVTRHLQTTYVPDRGGTPDGEIKGIYTLATDVTALKAVERHLDALARSDTLTGLANRRQFEERFPEAVARSQRSKRPMALMLLDIDHFKRINDTYGHGAGDAVLREFALRLNATVRAVDTVARLGGDEFAIILEGLNHRSEASIVANKIALALAGVFEIGGVSHHVTASVGVAFVDSGASNIEFVLEKADAALYRAKEAGRDTFALTTI